MNSQLEIFTGRTLKDRGMKIAIDHAGSEWAQKAYGYFMDFLSGIPEDRKFMTEQVRKYAADRGLESPPSDRAWGSITTRLAKEGYIIRVGFAQVENARAHMANASLWRKIS